MLGDVPDRLRPLRSHLFHLVLARVGIVGQVAHIGDVDHMGQLVTLEAERAAQNVGKDIGAHIADVRIVIDRRPAGIDPRLSGMDRVELFQLASQAVEQLERDGFSHGQGPYASLRPGQLPSRLREGKCFRTLPSGPLRPVVHAARGSC